VPVVSVPRVTQVEEERQTLLKMPFARVRKSLPVPARSRGLASHAG
jgi:hypothetical protein